MEGNTIGVEAAQAIGEALSTRKEFEVTEQLTQGHNEVYGVWDHNSWNQDQCILVGSGIRVCLVFGIKDQILGPNDGITDLNSSPIDELEEGAMG